MGRRPIPLLVSQPAAGADWLATPANEGWAFIRSITARLVTGTVITPRAPDLYTKNDNGDIIALDAAAYAQGQGQTMLYTWRSAAIFSGNLSPSIVVSGTCPGFWLPPGATIGTVTQNITAGDQWSNVLLTYNVTNTWNNAEELVAIQDLVANVN